MFKEFKKLAKDNQGFSLTEVLIGMMVLTVAIVASTNLLIGLIRSNQNAVGSLQAYYLAQEGIEAVRNIRDTNWLHNRSWLGEGSIDLWDGKLTVDEDELAHDIGLDPNGWAQLPRSRRPDENVSLKTINTAKPWSILEIGQGRILKYTDSQGRNFMSSLIGLASVDAKDTGFERRIYLFPYEEDCEQVCEDFVLVRSVVTWNEGENSVVLESVLTDWKGGAL